MLVVVFLWPNSGIVTYYVTVHGMHFGIAVHGMHLSLRQVMSVWDTLGEVVEY